MLCWWCGFWRLVMLSCMRMSRCLRMLSMHVSETRNNWKGSSRHESPEYWPKNSELQFEKFGFCIAIWWLGQVCISHLHLNAFDMFELVILEAEEADALARGNWTTACSCLGFQIAVALAPCWTPAKSLWRTEQPLHTIAGESCFGLVEDSVQACSSLHQVFDPIT